MNQHNHRRDYEACDRCGEVLYGNDAVRQHQCETLVLSSDEEHAVQLPKRRIVSQPRRKTHRMSGFIQQEDEEALILAVQERRPLWDISCPVAERNPQHIQKLWLEVSQELNGLLTPTQCKAKFKTLKETYRKIIQDELRPSGSAAPVNETQWEFYKIMEFLRDSCLVKSTRSNDEDVRKRKIPDEENSTSKKRKQSDTNTAMNKIAEAICTQSKLELPPMPSPPDEIDGFVTMIGSRMRLMTRAARDHFIITTTKAAMEASIEEQSSS